MKNSLLPSDIQELYVKSCSYWRNSDSENHIASRWIHRESNLMLTLESIPVECVAPALYRTDGGSP